MSDIFEFGKRFGRLPNVEEAQHRFVITINHQVFRKIDDWSPTYYSHSEAFVDSLCLRLNLEPIRVIRAWNKNNLVDDMRVPAMTYFTKDEFEKTMMVVEVARAALVETQGARGGEKPLIALIDQIVPEALAGPISLGISWVEGHFFPAGAKELDQPLIGDVLQWLRSHEKARVLFENALKHYGLSIKDAVARKDVITNVEQAIDVLSRELTNSSKSLDNNSHAVIAAVDLNKHWGNIIHSFEELRKEMGSHPGRKELIPSAVDTEAFLYLGGLLLRLLARKAEEKAP